MSKGLKILLFLLLGYLCTVETHAQGRKSGDQFSSYSILSSGKWFKIGLKDAGVYRVEFNQLKDLGFDATGEPRIYGNNFGQLSFYNRDPRPDDLVEIPVLINRGTDGVFNDGDYLLFYSDSPHRWEFTASYTHKRHLYSDSVFYYITTAPGKAKEIQTRTNPVTPYTLTSNSRDVNYIHENESENLIKSGREWYEPLSVSSGITVKPAFGSLVGGDTIKYQIRVAARGQYATTFRLNEGGAVRANVLVPEVNIYSTTGTYARAVSSSGYYIPTSTDPTFDITFHTNGDPQAKGWIDYLLLTGRTLSRYSGAPLLITDSRVPVNGETARYVVETGGAANLQLLDITNPSLPSVVPYSVSGNTISWLSLSDSLRKYILFAHQNLPKPLIFKNQVPNQNLHGSGPADMVILSHPAFLPYASKLGELHRIKSGLISAIVTPQMIYNEFSGGIPDINAIRNYLRMTWLRDKSSSNPLKYLLIFGDGSIDNKLLPPKNPNFVPTYQTQNSTVIVSSFMSDDFYGLLDFEEGEAEGYLDLGIGRLPVNDTTSAGIIVRKIERYLNDPDQGDWKSIISLIADDEDFNIHMSDAEGLAAVLEAKNPWINIEKIYLDAYRQMSSASGHSYPDATKAISDRINTGAVIVNYLGHGNELGLAHERVIKTETINSWRNKNKLPLFITATCEFSRFDDVETNALTGEKIPKISAGEMVLLNPEGGGIALLTTTRIVYSAPNYTLNKNLYNFAFETDSAGNALRLGEIMRLAKINSGSSTNKRNFSLLGDPALRISFPWNGIVVTDSINGAPVSGPTDTLRALSLITISGHIENNQGVINNTFNGIVHITLYDKPAAVTTLANDGGTPYSFLSQKNVLFKGKTEAKNGYFSTTLLVPKDINYTYGKGKISYYANNEEGFMRGNFKEVIVGGFNDPGITDITGPQIRIYMNDTLFRNGGLTDSNPRLIAYITDPGGINTTGNGIGHDITAHLDGDLSGSFVLNNYFEADLNSYTGGWVTFDLSGIKEGKHTLTLKAWDNFNNSAEGTINFTVKDNEEFILINPLNYPNPFLNGTSFSVEHNRPDNNLDIEIAIYDQSGRVLKKIVTTTYSGGYRIQPLYWDGTDDGGSRVGAGLYFYNISIRSDRSERATTTGKLIIL